MNFPLKFASPARHDKDSSASTAERSDDKADPDAATRDAHARQILAGLEAALLNENQPDDYARAATDWSAAGPAWRPRREPLLRRSTDSERSHNSADAHRVAESESDAGKDTVPPQLGSLGLEDRGSVDRLAAMLKARQLERQLRYADPVDDDLHDEDGYHDYQEPVHDRATEADSIGDRFGWEERYAAEDVQLYLEEPAAAPARRRLTSTLALTGAVIGASALAALYIIAPGGESIPASDTEAAAVEEPPAGTAETPAATAEPVVGAAAPPQEAAAVPATEAPAAVAGDVLTARPSFERAQPEPDAVGTTLPAATPGAIQAAGGTAIRRIEPAPTSREAVDAPAVRQVGPPAFGIPAAPEPSAEEPAVDTPEVTANEQVPTSGDNVTTSAAQTTTHVNMRSGPENDASVVTVIPANGSVELIGCDFWCEVIYDGQQGWVYRDFIAGAD